ncbi:MAG: hypothetical protein KF704_03745 [Crocinitomicaceae bacterium]|nr:hypothetical protein [Crocinitomicaceae bacterium]
MNALKNKPFLIFLILFLVVSIPLWTLPINFFPGVISYGNGIQDITEDAPLSLSYFIGLGYNEADMTGIKDFYLKPSGYMLAFIFTVGIPGLIAYRFSRKK